MRWVANAFSVSCGGWGSRRSTPGRGPANRIQTIVFTRICYGTSWFRRRTKCGARTSPTCRCSTDSCIWLQFWIGTADTYWRAHFEHARQRLLCGGPAGRVTSRPAAIFNTDQGTQFTSQAFTGLLEQKGIAISMDGRGRALDNVFIERLWWSVKYENIYVMGYETVAELKAGLTWYFEFYCRRRPHQSLDNRMPWEVYSTDRRKQQKVRR